MINKFGYTLTALCLGVLVMAPRVASAFPENIRFGYASCSQCHASPTGGGALNTFGRGFAQGFMSKWSSEGEGQLAQGMVKLPDNIMVGGDVRAVGFQRDNGYVTQQKFMLMQADVELAWEPIDKLTVDGSIGQYQTQMQSQRYYVMYQPTDNWSLRLGKFMPAFGINVADHAIPTKRWLGWNEGSANLRAEGAWLGEKGEVFVTATLGTGGEEEEEEGEEAEESATVSGEGVGEGEPSLENGYSARGAWYISDSMQVGLSLFQGEGPLFDRQVVGPYFMAGFGENYFLLSELDFQTETRVGEDDALPAKRSVRAMYNKAGWQVDQGLIWYLTVENLETDQSDRDVGFTALGTGLQWFPRPHLELLASLQQRTEAAYSNKSGNMGTVMFHYYF
jgi:hypothetical protein